MIFFTISRVKEKLSFAAKVALLALLISCVMPSIYHGLVSVEAMSEFADDSTVKVEQSQ